MDLYEAVAEVQQASHRWCEYLANNDREVEAEEIDVANDTVDKLLRLLQPTVDHVVLVDPDRRWPPPRPALRRRMNAINPESIDTEQEAENA